MNYYDPQDVSNSAYHLQFAGMSDMLLHCMLFEQAEFRAN